MRSRGIRRPERRSITDAHPSTTRDRSGTADRDADAQGDRANGEGHVAQEEGESLCSPAEALMLAKDPSIRHAELR
jgi:hypothetical protein